MHKSLKAASFWLLEWLVGLIQMILALSTVYSVEDGRIRHLVQPFASVSARPISEALNSVRFQNRTGTLIGFCFSKDSRSSILKKWKPSCCYLSSENRAAIIESGKTKGKK